MTDPGGVPASDLRAFLVDDHNIVRAGIKAMLVAKGCTIVGEASTGEEAITAIDALIERGEVPNLIVMDVQMPGMGGLQAVKEIKAAHPEVNVLMLTMNADRASLREAFRVGASGYVLKDAVDAELLDAARAVAAGGRYLHPSLGADLVRAEQEAQSGRRDAPRGVALSQREMDVVRLVAAGYSNKEIAEELYLSVRTVETHKTHIIQKTGLRARSDLIRFARDAGILDGED